jgi:hypothetical protein
MPSPKSKNRQRPEEIVAAVSSVEWYEALLQIEVKEVTKPRKRKILRVQFQIPVSVMLSIVLGSSALAGADVVGTVVKIVLENLR